MDMVKGILLKLASALLFALMSALIRWLGEAFPVGQVVFFRSAFAIIPVVMIYAFRGELWTAFRTGRPFGHIGRGFVGITGMFFNFAALARLPLADATAISFASPLIIVVLAWLFLNEQVRIYRWSAVLIGFAGVMVMLLPYMHIGDFAGMHSPGQGAGALFAVTAAFCNSGAVVQTRRLTDSETTSAIVLYFSLICTLAGLLTLPFAWHSPSALELAALISIGVLGGISHILLTESYRLAPASVVAPFDYTAIIWAFVLGYAMFGEVPVMPVFIGALIVIAAGLLVIWRERRLGIRRAKVAAAAASVSR